MIDTQHATRIRNALRTAIDRREISGANLMVIHNGEEAFYHEDGFADIEKGLPIHRNSLFRLYSMSKPVTAAAAMILMERGEIDLYEPVSKFLPGFRDQKVAVDGKLVPVEREATLHDLLGMTSGLAYGGDHPTGKATEALFAEMDARLFGDNPMSTLEAMNRLGECPLLFHPGSDWNYGTSADVLGAVIEVVSGMRLGEFMKRELFAPLGMHDTGFWLPTERQNGRMARTYATNGPDAPMSLYEGNHLGIIHTMDREPAFESGGAGLVSTIDDYARFTRMLMNDGEFEGGRILSEKTVAYYRSCTLDAWQQDGFIKRFPVYGNSYGNLMRVMTNPEESVGHACFGEYGWDGWLGCYFTNCPYDGLTFLFMTQRKDAGTMPITRKLRNIVMSACCEG